MADSIARKLVAATQEAADRCETTLSYPHWRAKGEYDGVYCRECADQLFPDDIDGGWTMEEDGARFCEACSKPLEFILTDYGVEQELAELEETGICTDHDAYTLHRVLNAGGHPLLTERCGDWEYRPEWKDRVRCIYERHVARKNQQEEQADG